MYWEGAGGERAHGVDVVVDPDSAVGEEEEVAQEIGFHDGEGERAV